MLRRSTGLMGLMAFPRDLLASAIARMGSEDRPHLATAERAATWIRTARRETEHGVVWAWNPTESPDESVGTLYTGSPGVILFYLELHHASGRQDALEEARRGADHLVASLEDEGRTMGAGLYTGLAGWAFVLEEVYGATGDARYRQAAVRAETSILEDARAVGRGVEWNGSTDIISGNAGIGLWLLRAAEREGGSDPSHLALAVGSGRRLLEVAEPEAGGLKWAMRDDVQNRYPNFSHGTGGVAYFLATLYQATGDESFLDAALAGVEYLDAVARKEDGACRVFHHEPGGEDLYYLSWCHGPPGTARLFRRLEAVTGDVAWRERISCFARGVMEMGAPERRSAGYWNNVSQCCGDSGVGEFFLTLLQYDPRPGYRDMVDRVTTRLLSHADRDDASGGLRWVQAEHRVRPEWTVPQTGFMQGAAGIGTYFLHLDGVARGRPRRVRWPDSPWEEPG